MPACRSWSRGITSDRLYPLRLQEELAELLPGAGVKVVESIYGHDGFLVETDAVAVLIRRPSNWLQTTRRSAFRS